MNGWIGGWMNEWVDGSV